MEPIQVAAPTPAAKWATESVVRGAAKSAFASFRPMYEWVRAKLVDAPAGKTAVDKLGSDPKDESNVANLAALGPKTHSFVVYVLDSEMVGKIVNIGPVQRNVSF
jgi:hypothetical protein